MKLQKVGRYHTPSEFSVLSYLAVIRKESPNQNEDEAFIFGFFFFFLFREKSRKDRKYLCGVAEIHLLPIGGVVIALGKL